MASEAPATTEPTPAPAPAAAAASRDASPMPTANKAKPSTLSKMGFAPAAAAPMENEAAATAAAVVAPPPTPTPITTAETPRDGKARGGVERARMIVETASSSLAFVQAAKQRRKPWYRPSLVRLIRLAQLLLVIRWTIPPLQMYRRGSICPYAVVCSTGFVEIGLLCVSKITALMMYPLFALVFLSKCATLRTFFQHTCVSRPPLCASACTHPPYIP